MGQCDLSLGMRPHSDFTSRGIIQHLSGYPGIPRPADHDEWGHLRLALSSRVSSKSAPQDLQESPITGNHPEYASACSGSTYRDYGASKPIPMSCRVESPPLRLSLWPLKASAASVVHTRVGQRDLSNTDPPIVARHITADPRLHVRRQCVQKQTEQTSVLPHTAAERQRSH